MVTLPPRQVCIAAALVIAGGVGSIFNIITSAIAGNLNLDFGFIGIPLGYGLLLGWSFPRKLLLGLGIFTLVIAVGGIIFLLLSEDSLVSPFLKRDLVYGGILTLIGFCGLVYILWALMRKESKAWFALSQEDGTFAKTFTYAVSVVAALFYLSICVTNWWVEDALDNVYTFRVAVSPIDADTGEFVRTFSSGNFDSKNNGRSLPVVNENFSSSADSFEVIYSGVAAEPVEVVYIADGYEDTPFVIDRRTGGHLKLLLKPLVKVMPTEAIIDSTE